MKITIVETANRLLTTRKIMLIKKFVFKIIIFQLDYHMLMNGLKKFGLVGLILLIIQQKI